MTITEKSNAVKGKLEFPTDSERFRLFWDWASKNAGEESDIKKMRTELAGLSRNASDAETQALKKVRKSRSSF